MLVADNLCKDRHHHAALSVFAILAMLGCGRSRSPASEVRADAPPAPSQAPRLIDLEIGRWSEYAVGAPGLRLRQVAALVSASDERASIETMTWMDGSPTPRVVTRDTYPIRGRVGDATLATAVQIAAHRPMELPSSARPDPGGLGLRNLTRETFVGVEEITAAGRRFHARRYRLKQADGQRTDVWVSDEVQPIGIVRMAAADGPGDDGGIELVRMGGGARPAITETPGPYDRQAYVQQMTAPSSPPLTSRPFPTPTSPR